MSQAVNHTASHTASRAVELLIVDEPSGLDARMRAELEHAPALRTIGEDDLARGGPVPAVALVPVDGAGAEAGCARIAALREGRPWLRVLAVFRTLDASAMNRLIAAGADAFVGCGTPADEVCASVLALAKGAPPTPSAAAASACPPTEDPAIGLTPREAEVLRFLSAGFSNKEVARRLSLSVRTVETHRLNLRRKTQTGRLKDLVTLARQLGLAPVLDTEAPRSPARHTAHAARA
ncbi:response regulator transcription factor [Methylorubrum extorquens]|jgi:DNA-binding NarL/FixJ family response regulator|uniref:Response regulator, CheY-like and LuxR domain n=2 Tax=Methylorubrum extorquens TaxID=408 RepID=C5B1X9_METEA|nr:response regulator transcription factor [Methylorubrum extorquens]ACS39763.1 putative Response regulator, CheY- like and LuxR domain [Methylorubrum extorquens AM1]EHP91468.1 transcriptional regulator, LuxR family [Methylorubrum extorquens DSM 13060]MCP1542096.1 DNA-binding NarL/FixJ family response regulator [Methylorubrum extorquens]MCP1590559.1 DNA-binding NarL/FixJ family response regulator [Methylorubrum extorquens]